MKTNLISTLIIMLTLLIANVTYAYNDGSISGSMYVTSEDMPLESWVYLYSVDENNALIDSVYATGGEYTFENVAEGWYFVEFVAPDVFEFTYNKDNTGSKVIYTYNSIDGAHTVGQSNIISVEPSENVVELNALLNGANITLDLELQQSLSAIWNADKNTVDLSWHLVHDDATKVVILQSSNATKGYKEIGQLNVDSQEHFTFHKRNVAQGQHYYKIRIHLANGEKAYSQIAGVLVPELVSLITISPNPASDNTTVQLSDTSHPTQVSLISAHGQLIYTQKVTSDQGSIDLDISGLSDGLYYVRTEGLYSAMQKLVVRK